MVETESILSLILSSTLIPLQAQAGTNKLDYYNTQLFTFI